MIYRIFIARNAYPFLWTGNDDFHGELITDQY